MQILSHWSKLTDPKSLVVECEDQDFYHFFWKRNTDENKLYFTQTDLVVASDSDSNTCKIYATIDFMYLKTVKTR